MLNVGQFGAVGDGVTDDGPALRKALEAAATASREREEDVRLTFEAGRRYRVGPWDAQWCTLPLRDAHGLVIEGNGAELLVHPKNRAFQLDGCEGVRIRGLVVDYDPLPFTQGDVVSVDYGAKTFVVRLHEGYPEPPEMSWVQANGGTFDHGVFIEAPPSDLFTHRWVYVASVTPVAGSARTYTLAAGRGTEEQIAPEKVVAGQRFAFTMPYTTREEVASREGQDERGVWISRRTASVQVYDSRDCVFEDVDHYTSPYISVFMEGCSDLVFRRCRIMRRPGTDRLISGVSDGIHGWCRRGPLVEDCTFGGTMDDSMGFQYMAHVVMERLGDRRFRLAYTNIAWHDTRLREGDVLEAWDPVNGVVLGEGRIVKLEFVASHTRIAELDRPVEGIRDVAHDLGGDAGKNNQASQFYLKNESPMVVRHCRFGTQLKEAVRICYSAVVEDNEIADTAYGINCTNDPAWWAGPHARDLVYRNNRITGAWPYAIGVQVLCQTGKPAPVRGGVVVEGNQITVRPLPWGSPVMEGILLSNLRGVTVRGNTVVMESGVPAEIPAVRLRNCAEVVMEGNAVDDRRAAPGRGIVEE